jgi:hypothetical protein
MILKVVPEIVISDLQGRSQVKYMKIKFLGKYLGVRNNLGYNITRHFVTYTSHLVQLVERIQGAWEWLNMYK